MTKFKPRTSPKEYLDRAHLWSLVQAADPEKADMERIAAEKVALDAYVGRRKASAA